MAPPFQVLTIAALLGLSQPSGECAEKKASATLEPRGAAAPDAPKAATPSPDALYTREWKIAPNLIPVSGPADRDAAKNWLIAKGVIFQGQALAEYQVHNSRLIVRNTQAQLDLIEVIVNPNAK